VTNTTQDRIHAVQSYIHGQQDGENSQERGGWLPVAGRAVRWSTSAVSVPRPRRVATATRRPATPRRLRRRRARRELVAWSLLSCRQVKRDCRRIAVNERRMWSAVRCHVDIVEFDVLVDWACYTGRRRSRSRRRRSGRVFRRQTVAWLSSFCRYDYVIRRRACTFNSNEHTSLDRERERGEGRVETLRRCNEIPRSGN